MKQFFRVIFGCELSDKDKEIFRRIEALEKDSYPGNNFTELVRRIDNLEAHFLAEVELSRRRIDNLEGDCRAHFLSARAHRVI